VPTNYLHQVCINLKETLYDMARFMIYGTCYTGRLACEYARSIGLDFVCAGRDERVVKTLAWSLKLQHRIFGVDNRSEIDSALENVDVLLNCAGPFARTARPFIDACIRNRVHYLDISAELESYHYAEECSDDAIQAGVMLLPGCGGSVSILSGLVQHALKDIHSLVSIDIALHVSGSTSRGSAIGALESLTVACLQRLHGKLVPQETTTTRRFNFDDGNGDVECFSITLPDLITIWNATGVPNVKTYVHAVDDVFPKGDSKTLPDGPSAEEREENPYHAAVEFSTANGKVRRAILHTVNGYTFTSVASVETARRVLNANLCQAFRRWYQYLEIKFWKQCQAQA
jgi:short subunit dehydrogenase-like uncharacterized protein